MTEGPAFDARSTQLHRIETEFGGFAAVDSLCKGAVIGALMCMDESISRELLTAALHAPSLATLSRRLETRDMREDALVRAAAGGFTGVCGELLAAGARAEVSLCIDQGRVAITRQSVVGKHCEAATAAFPLTVSRLASGVTPEEAFGAGTTALMFASLGGHSQNFEGLKNEAWGQGLNF